MANDRKQLGSSTLIFILMEDSAKLVREIEELDSEIFRLQRVVRELQQARGMKSLKLEHMDQQIAALDRSV